MERHSCLMLLGDSIICCGFIIICCGFITLHNLETLPLPVKGFKLWPILGTQGNWAVRIPLRATPVTRGIRFIMVISEDPWQSHMLPSVRQCSFHYLFKRLRSVPHRGSNPDRPHARRTIYTKPPRNRQTPRARVDSCKCTLDRYLHLWLIWVGRCERFVCVLKTYSYWYIITRVNDWSGF